MIFWFSMGSAERKERFLFFEERKTSCFKNILLSERLLLLLQVMKIWTPQKYRYVLDSTKAIMYLMIFIV